MFRNNVYPKKYFTGKTVNNDEQTIKFFTVIGEKNLSKIKEFITSNNININIQNENGDSALHILLRDIPDKELNNIYNILKYLIQNGIAINKKNSFNITPLHYAINNQQEEIVNLLLEHNADAMAIDNEGMSVFHHFVSSKVQVCESEKNVGSIIPENNTSYSTKEINNLTKCIIDIYLSKSFNYLVKHVDNTVADLDKIFPLLFAMREGKIIENMNNIVNDNIKNNFEKKNNIATVINQSMKSLYDDINGKLPMSLKKIAIQSGYIGGFYPDTSSVDSDYIKYNVQGILPYNHIKDIFERNMEADKIKEMSVKSLNNYMININNNVQDFKNVLINIHENCFKICNLTDNLLFNSDFPMYNSNQVQINNPDFTFIYFNNHNTYINTINVHFFPDYNNNEISDLTLGHSSLIQYNQINNLLFNGHFNDIQLIRALKNDIETARKNKKNIEEYPLSLDINPTTGIYINNFNTKTRSIKNHQLGDILNQIEHAFNAEPIFFITDFVHRFILIDGFKDTINTLINDLLNKKGYINKINNIKDIIYHNLYLIKNIHNLCDENINNKVITIIKTIEQDLTSLFSDNLSHPYAYLLEHSIDHIKDIYKLFSKIPSILSQIYENSMMLHEALILYVNFINKEIGESFIIKYFDLKNDISIINNSSITINIDGTSSSPINLVSSLPKTLKDFIKEYKNDTKLIEKYIPLINKFNCPIYYSTLVSNKTKIIPKIGYLISDHLAIKNTDPFIPGGYISNIRDLNNANVDINKNRYKIGNYGAHNIPYTFKLNEHAINSIGDNLDLHLYMLKFLIIQNIMALFYNTNKILGNTPTPIIDQTNTDLINNINEQKNSILDYIKKISGTAVLNKTSMYIMVGKIVDELFITYLDTAIGNFCNNYIKKLLFNTDNKQIKQITEKIYGDDSVLFLKKKFPFDYSQKKYIKQILNNNNNNKIDKYLSSLRFNQSLILTTKDISKDNKYYVLYSQNYNCTIVNNNIFKQLLKYNKRVNIVDKNNMSPLFYAAQSLNTDLVKLILPYSDLNIKNNMGYSILDFTKQNIINHCNSLSNLNNEAFETIKNDIFSRNEFKNNILVNMDNIFDQFLYMYNQIFYISLINYDNFWTFNNTKNIIDLLIKYNLIKDPNFNTFIDVPFYTFIIENEQFFSPESDYTLYINNIDVKLKNEINNSNIKITKINNSINEINSEINYINGTGSPDYNNKRTSDIQLFTNNKKNDINNITNLKNELNDNDKRLISILSKKENNFYNDIINNYIIGHNLNTVAQTYDNLYAHFKDYGMFYNNLWKHFITKNKVNNDDITNSHNIINNLLKQIVQNNESNTNQIKELNILSSFYTNIFPIIDPKQLFNNNTYFYNGKNIILTYIMDIIVHIVGTNILNNMYYAIIKLVLKYIQDSNMAFDDKDPLFYNNIIKKFTKYDDYALQKYIIKELPLILTKFILQLYEKHVDEHTNITMDMAFDKILELLISNGVYNIDQTSPIVKNINEYIFPYYKFVILQFIPKMKESVENYNKYIINESRNVIIYTELLKKKDQGN